MYSDANPGDNNDNKKFENSDDALNETRRRLETLNAHLAAGGDTPLVTDASRIAVWQISRSYFDWPDWRQGICGTLCELKYPELAISITKQLFETGPAVDDATSKFSLNLFTSLWNFSKLDGKFRNLVGSTGAVPIFLDYLVTVHMYLDYISTKEPPEQYPLEKWAILKAVISVLHQLAKQRDLIAQFNVNKGVQILGKLASVDNNAIKFVSACCLALVTSSRDLQMLKFDDFFSVLHHGLDQALENPDSPYYHGFDQQEIADALFLFAFKSDSRNASVEATENLILTDKLKEIKIICEMIVDEDETKQKYGAILFRGYCDKEFDVDWIRPVYSIAVQKKPVDEIQQARALRATEFLTEYQAWLKSRHGEPIGEKSDLSAFEIMCFMTKKNASIKAIDDLVSETEIRVKFLAKFADLAPDRLISREVYGVVEEIRMSYHKFMGNRTEILSASLREGLPGIIPKYLDHFVSAGLTQPRINFCISSTLLKMLWSFTDFSPQLRLELAKTSVLKTLLDYLAAESKIDRSKRTNEENVLISVMINIVYNMSRSMELKAQFLQLNAANVCLPRKILKEYLGVSELIKSVVILCLAHILSDTPEATQLAIEQGVITNISKYTTMAMKRSDRMCHLADRDLSAVYSLEELVEGLALLAVNDSIKKQLMDHNACEIISYLLKSGAPNLEVRGVDLLWTLSFEQTVRNQLLASKEDLIGSLRPLVTSSETTPEVREHAAKTLSFIENWQRKMKEAEDSLSTSFNRENGGKSGHIFISYSWKQQKMVLRIREELVKHNYTVWMDIDNLHGDLLEAMATAIEQASAVLLCFSNAYKQSNPCRTEAQYAHTLGKPIVPVNMEYHYFPDGWLGILVRSRKFVDMSIEKRTFEESFKQLLNELNALGAVAGTSNQRPLADENHHNQTAQNPLGGGHSIVANDPGQVSKGKFCNWSVDDVHTWLEREDLIEFEAIFHNFDGKMLNTLISMKSSAPEFYHQTVSKYCCTNGTLFGLVKLLGALDRLALE